MAPSTFLHLSDIHFRKNTDTPYDASKNLREELEADAERKYKELGGIHAILVSGDIAFSGHEDEYKVAHSWLQRLCAKVGCPLENVWVIPGNHDVDRQIVKKSMLIQSMHRDLRGEVATLDEKLAKYMASDPEAAKLIYRPIQNYVDFAAKYGCSISALNPYWEQDWPLNDGSILRIRGVNSTIVSDKEDNDASNKLVVGRRQLEMTRQDGVEYMVLCHHPPSWLFDQDSAEDLFCTRAKIHLFGHKHRQRVLSIGDGVRVTSGAMHPDEREPNWQPRYNIVQVSVEKDPEQRRCLKVVVRPRVYSEEHTQFVAEVDDKTHDNREFKCPLPDWQPVATMSKTASDKKTEAHVSNPQPVRGSKMDPGRKLTYQFMDLDHHTKLRIAEELGLIMDDDQGLRDSELCRKYFVRAAEKGKLADLWDAVQKEYGGAKQGNPYTKNAGAD